MRLSLSLARSLASVAVLVLSGCGVPIDASPRPVELPGAVGTSTASPTPSYSCIVSIMSSISRWNPGSAICSGATSLAGVRTTGWPMRATFRIIYL